jgi:hypothetical protein
MDNLSAFWPTREQLYALMTGCGVIYTYLKLNEFHSSFFIGIFVGAHICTYVLWSPAEKTAWRGGKSLL